MTLTHHLGELRRRLLYTFLFLIVTFGFAYLYAAEIFNFLAQPLIKAYQYQNHRKFIYTGLPEAFLCYVKVSLFTAFCLSFPIIAQQIWAFIAPGLYRREKKLFFPLLIASPVLFAAGSAFAYYFIIPMAWQFFLKFESLGGLHTLPIQLEARMGEYLSTTLQIIMVFGICFELPVILVLLSVTKILNSDMLMHRRKYIFLIILIVSAILTPPDVLSMIGLAVPLYGLFELSILFIKMIEKRNQA